MIESKSLRVLSIEFNVENDINIFRVAMCQGNVREKQNFLWSGKSKETLKECQGILVI